MKSPPTKDKEKKKSEKKKKIKETSVKIRLSPEEKEAWVIKANLAGLSVSELMRKLMSGARIKDVSTRKEIKQLNRELGAIGNNLNQIARWANTYKGDAVAQSVNSYLDSIRDELAKLNPDVT